MENSNITKYFLGANSRYGFYSLYDEFTDPINGDFLWVIKGGPGCGKSSFMKKIAQACEAEGLPVEYIYCSGDPNSLDAIRLPTLGTAYTDGTAPHVVDAVYPGAASLYLDLGTYYDAGALEKELSNIIDLNINYKDMYRKAYAHLAAAADVSPKNISGLWGTGEKDKIDKKVERFAAREFRIADEAPVTKNRFISAISCQGRILLQDTISSQYEKVYILDNELGLGNYYLDKLSKIAERKGQSMVLCHDPLDPKLLEAVLFPTKKLAFIILDNRAKFDSKVFRHIRLDNLVNKEKLITKRPELRQAKRFEDELLKYGMAVLHEAKHLHDELENIYNPHVDFDGVYSVAQDHISWLLGKN